MMSNSNVLLCCRCSQPLKYIESYVNSHGKGKKYEGCCGGGEVSVTVLCRPSKLLNSFNDYTKGAIQDA